jgi:hypothetical protein
VVIPPLAPPFEGGGFRALLVSPEVAVLGERLVVVIGSEGFPVVVVELQRGVVVDFVRLEAGLLERPVGINGR